MNLKIGENIRKYRRESNLTQQQFADKLGVTYQSVSRWENGETYPDIELIPSIAEFFNTTIDNLMGVPEIEKDKQACKVFDALRRECMKPSAEINTAEVVSLLQDIRRNYRNCPGSSRMWVEGNTRCFSIPEILPEIRLTAEAFLALNPMDPHVLEQMAYCEDEENIGAFLKKNTTPFDTSQRELLYHRYLFKGDKERLEPERRYRLYDALDRLLDKRTLLGIINHESKEADDVVLFQSRLLECIRNSGSEDTPDTWTDARLTLGIERASILARYGKPDEAMKELTAVALLLENTMKIRETQPLDTSCCWLNGMEWKAEETWFQKNNNPDGLEERAIYLYTEMSGMTSCFLIFPSTYYMYIKNIGGAEYLQALPEYQDIISRVKALIETRPKEV